MFSDNIMKIHDAKLLISCALSFAGRYYEDGRLPSSNIKAGDSLSQFDSWAISKDDLSECMKQIPVP